MSTFDVRAEQGPLQGCVFEAREGADGEVAIDGGALASQEDLARYTLSRAPDEILRRRYAEAEMVTREELDDGEMIWSVWLAGASDPWLVYGAEDVTPALLWNGPAHKCSDHASYYEGDGPLGHGYTCAVCGALLQVG